MHRGDFRRRLDIYHRDAVRQINSFMSEYDPENFYDFDIDIKDFHIMENDPRRRVQRNKEIYPIVFMNKRFRWEDAGQRSYHVVL